MNFIISSLPISKVKLESVFSLYHTKYIEGIHFYFEDGRGFYEFDDILSFVNGYLCDFSKDNQDVSSTYYSSIQTIIEQWPITNPNISGSFTLLALHLKKQTISFCNDPIGIYPLYYNITGEDFFISSSLILASITSTKGIDEVGLAQRALGKEFLNIGSRTILKDVKRLLPGEYVCFNYQTGSVSKSYDNSLYKDVAVNNKTSKKDYGVFWDLLKKEMAYALSQFESTYLALSGGLDSRILLGALPASRPVKCVTYGSPENYEVKLAKRLAKVKGYDFENFYDIDQYFPKKEVLKDYALHTEPLNITNWLEILEHLPGDKNAAMVLGEPCEILPGRNIKVLSSRHSRIQNFVKTNLLNEDFKFNKGSFNTFQEWKSKTIKNALKNYTKVGVNNLDITMPYDSLIEEIIIDYNELLSRIEDHKLPYIELYDELFAWYTHGRFPIGRQTLICNHKFNGINPSMSLQVLRASSAIHPNQRLNYRFMNGLFKNIKDLKKLNKIPTSQAPLIPHNFPDLFIFLIWGIRSKWDQFFIRRLMKKKDPKARYRLFKSLNWVKVYQHPHLKDRLDSYYKINYVGAGLFEYIKRKALERQQLKRWPLSNIDVISISSLNIEIGIIKKINDETE